MKKMNCNSGFKILAAILCLAGFSSLYAQNTVDSSILDRLDALEQQVNYKKPGEDHFMVVGLTTFGFVANKTTNTLNGANTIAKTNSLADADHYEFSPMFLWRHGKRFLMEFEPSFSNGSLGVNWADISYFAAPGLIIRAGYLVLPFGTYAKREAAGWINKLATDPIGITGIPPTSDYAVEAEGGLPLGTAKMSYDVALSNGNQLQPDGTIQNAGIVDNNKNKTITARLGLLPFSNSSVEVGVSGQFGKLGNESTPSESAKGNMYAFDFNYVKTFKPILLNVKAQYNVIDITNESYVSPSDSTKSYTFNNHTTAGFAQCSIRPVGVHNTFLKNTELAFRYSDYRTPSGSTWGNNQHAIDIGIDYWLSWRTVFKISYQSLSTKSTSPEALNAYTGNTTGNSLYVQFSIQL